LLMSIDPDSDLEEDDEIGVVIDRRNVHLFDSATGEAIVHDLLPYEAEETASGSSGEVESDD
ncbi:ABC transporter ATP-binding protein, partial [Haloarcula sp. CBA1130]